MAAGLSVWRRLEGTLDRFIPSAILAAPESARRARFAVALAWLSAVLFIVATIVQGKINSSALLALNASSAVICVAAPFAIRRFGRPTLICAIVLGLSFVKYVAVVAFWRGAGLNGATVMLGIMPLVATFLLGSRVGLAWMGASLVTGFTIALLGRGGVLVDHLPAENRLVNDHFILAISTVILFTVAWLYERMKDAAQRQIYELEAARQTAELERVHAVARSQLAEAQRLASLGRIAAATAHQINSPLVAVIANLQLAEEQTLSGELAESISEALASARRIGAIVADMNAYSRPRVESGTISVAEAIATAVKVAQPHTQARAHVTQQLADGLPRVVADTGLIDVLLDLVVLAAETFPEGNAAANEIAIAARLASADSVAIEVTGVADSPTNLALAVCRTIVDKLGGTLTVEAGERPLARLVLAAAKPVAAAPAATGPLPVTARLSILVVDDDEAILAMLKRVLSAHSITIARGGREALALLETRELDLILCDLMMPELTGMDLYEQLVAKDASYAERFVFMTGGTFTRRADEFRQTVTNHFVEKPFNLSDIRRIIAGFAARTEKQRGATTAA